VREEFGRSLQITVIAADFHEVGEVDRTRSVRRERIKTDQNLDVPTFLRREREADDEEEETPS
jgi:hypothetical protein